MAVDFRSAADEWPLITGRPFQGSDTAGRPHEVPLAEGNPPNLKPLPYLQDDRQTWRESAVDVFSPDLEGLPYSDHASRISSSRAGSSSRIVQGPTTVSDTGSPFTNERRFYCYRCPHRFRNARGLKQHVRETCDRAREFRCPHEDCTQVYVRHYMLENHDKTVHHDGSSCGLVRGTTAIPLKQRHAYGCGLCACQCFQTLDELLQHHVEYCHRHEEDSSPLKLVMSLLQQPGIAEVWTIIVQQLFGAALTDPSDFLRWSLSVRADLVHFLEGAPSTNSLQPHLTLVRDTIWAMSRAYIQHHQSQAVLMRVAEQNAHIAQYWTQQTPNHLTRSGFAQHLPASLQFDTVHANDPFACPVPVALRVRVIDPALLMYDNRYGHGQSLATNTLADLSSSRAACVEVPPLSSQYTAGRLVCQMGDRLQHNPSIEPSRFDELVSKLGTSFEHDIHYDIGFDER